MGDACDIADIERFLRSDEGKTHVKEIREILQGRTVTDVTFSNEGSCIATTLHLDNGKTFVVFQPSLDVRALREQFGEAIEEEYFLDYPDRRPKEGSK